ncbi:hypothetical protein [Gorillibacterium sp. sgz500922]|uniref:hypothetical protein n=1 Tax=Gorillibacterium sp. sgz500922 TaxID=3446694 RepID=UPI003F670339
MKQDQLKTALDRLQPAPELKSRIAQAASAAGSAGAADTAANRRPGPRRCAPFAATAAAVLLLAAGAGYYFADRHPAADAPLPSAAAPSPNGAAGQSAAPLGIAAPGAVYLPKVDLPDSSGPLMDMIGLFVYKGRIYTQTMSRIAPADAAALRGEKLGHTKGGIDEWSKQSEFTKELASTIGETDIYAVKGYDESFRLMAYQELDGQVYAELYENLNDRTLTSGADLFGLLRLEGNVAEASYLPFDSWNNGVEKRIPLPDQAAAEAFVQALASAKPLESRPLVDSGIYDSGADQAFLRLRLKDGVETELRLFKQGYVSYGMPSVFFQVEESAFGKLWNELQALNGQ